MPHRNLLNFVKYVYIYERLLELGGWAKRFGLIEDYVQCWAGLNFFKDPPGPGFRSFSDTPSSYYYHYYYYYYFTIDPGRVFFFF